jgi:hypothetical protein
VNSLTQDEARRVFTYVDGKLYWRIAVSRKTVAGREAGTLRTTDGYRQVILRGKTYRTHRVIFAYHHGYTPALIDHIDGDVANNRVENLREATRHENAYNSRVRPDNTSGTRGVTYDRAKRKWVVRLHVAGKCLNLGRFADQELADLVAHEARDKYHGAFARHS